MRDRRFVLLRDVVIPAGTVLERAANERGGTSAVECVVALGPDSHGYFVIAAADGDAARDAEGWVEECRPAAA